MKKSGKRLHKTYDFFKRFCVGKKLELGRRSAAAEGAWQVAWCGLSLPSPNKHETNGKARQIGIPPMYFTRTLTSPRNAASALETFTRIWRWFCSLENCSRLFLRLGLLVSGLDWWRIIRHGGQSMYNAWIQFIGSKWIENRVCITNVSVHKAWKAVSTLVLPFQHSLNTADGQHENCESCPPQVQL